MNEENINYQSQLSNQLGESDLKTPRFEHLQFTGSALEYFKIWIVNLVLTILTLGVYSAWAKVRRTKYFYNHTWLRDNNFEFTANPVKILKGRILMLFIYGVFIGSGKLGIMPIYAVVSILLAASIPWILIKSRRFKLRNTTYLGLRFDFSASYWQALRVIYLNPFLAVITLMILKPYDLRQRGRFLISNASYANIKFIFNSQNTKFGKLILKLLGFVVLCLAINAALIMGPTFLKLEEEIISILKVITIIPFLAIYLGIALFLLSCRNEYVNNSSFNGAALQSTISPLKLLWIYISNTILVAFTLGLLYPWSKVRIHKYKIENTYISKDLTLEELRGSILTQDSALAEEADDFMDLDFGI